MQQAFHVQPGFDVVNAVLNGLIVLSVVTVGVVLRRLICALNVELANARRVYRWHHTQATYISTVRGLVGVLEHASNNGGLPLETRQTIYAAINEAFNAYDQAQHPAE